MGYVQRENSASYSSTYALRPAATTVPAGVLHISTDTGTLSRSNGLTWDELTIGSGGLAQPLTFTAAPLHDVQAHTASASMSAAAGRLNTFAGAAGQLIEAPPAIEGSDCDLFNIDSADSCTVTADGSDVFRPAGVSATAFTLPAGMHVRLVCLSTGTWDILQLNEVRVAALPASPFHGMRVDFSDATMQSNGISWPVRYNVGDAGSYKWHACGQGAPIVSTTDTNQTTTSTSYANLGTIGPSLDLPANGDYDIEVGCVSYSSTASVVAWMSFAIGASAATDADGRRHAPSTSQASAQVESNRRIRKTGLSLSNQLVAKYKAGSAGTVGFINRRLAAYPIRIG